MLELDVYFVDPKEEIGGSAVLIENIITEKVQLKITDNILYCDEVLAFIEKAKKRLEYKNKTINVNIHWDTVKSKRESEELENVITSK